MLLMILCCFSYISFLSYRTCDGVIINYDKVLLMIDHCFVFIQELTIYHAKFDMF